MATDKLFTVAGISKLNGEYKVRFANDIMRIKVLAKHGHEDIRLADLEKAVTKLEAARMILAMEDFADSLAQVTITEYLEDKTPKTAVKATPQAKQARLQAASAAAVKTMKVKAVKVAEDEDAPF
jgi:hypothetical protein